VAQVIWTGPARRDLREIHTFIARDSKRSADALVRGIRSAVQRLADFPESGRVIPEYEDDKYREIVVSPYRVPYRYQRDHDLVEVLLVVHARRQMRLNGS
jgi:toxin ParE1/3/4